MISILDSTKLALTKFKTRRVRLAVVTIVSGLMFVNAVVASLLTRGFLHSATAFSQDGLSSRYIAALSPQEKTMYNNDAIAAELKDVDKKVFAERTAEAKRLGINYDSKSDTASINTGSKNEPVSPNFDTPQARAWLQNYYEKNTPTYVQKLEELKKKYSVINQYQSFPITQFAGAPSTTAGLSLTIVKDGKETVKFKQAEANYSGPTTGLASITEGWTALDSPLITPFLLDGQNLEIGSDGSIPIVAPYDAVEEAIGLSKLSDNANGKERLERLKQVRAAAGGKVFSVCLRNSTSMNRYQNALAAQGKTSDPNTPEPDLVYQVNSVPCADVTVKRDVRTDDQKALDAKQQQFEQKFGISEAPVQKMLKFRIVGISKESQFSVSLQASLLDALLGSNIGSSWYSPIEAVKKTPELSARIASFDASIFGSKTTFVETKDAASLKKLLEGEECKYNIATVVDLGAECIQKGKYFYAQNFGSNSLAIDKFKNGFLKVFHWALFIIAIMSSIVLMGTVGKIIADSRRETAVFRAIGAKRSDIAQIYLTYVVQIGLAICVFIFIVGFLIAKLIAHKYEPLFTNSALTAFNAKDLTKAFSLIHLSGSDAVTIILVVLTGCVASALIPLLANLKRSPMNDMRDER